MIKVWLVPAAFITAMLLSFGGYTYFSIVLVAKMAQISPFTAGGLFTIAIAIGSFVFRMIYWAIDEWYKMTDIDIVGDSND